MANNQQLPRPNVPTPTASHGSGGGPPKTGPSSAGPSQNQFRKGAAQAPHSITAPPSQAKTSSSPPPATPIAGLDPQSPGGAPPQLNERGQVTHTSNISASRKAPKFGKPDAPPMTQSARLNSSANNTKSPMQQAMSQSSFKPGSNQEGQNSHKKVENLATEKNIQPTQLQQRPSSKQMPTIRASQAGQGVPSAGAAPGSVQPNQQNSTKQKAKAKSAHKPAKPKKKSNPLKLILFGLIGLVVVGGIGYGITQILGLGGSGGLFKPDDTNGIIDDSPGQGEPGDSGPGITSTATITYWGLWEPEFIMEEVLDDFETQTGIKVNYIQQSPQDYRTRLQSRIASGEGPDVFRFHATWVPMLKEELAPMPNNVMTAADYEEIYYPIMVEQLQHKGQIVGIPLMYDGLALYYNKEILEAANEEVPSTWAELRVLAQKLTVRDRSGIKRSGLAIGNTTNIDHFSDILGMLIFQNGGDPSQPLSTEVRDAIQFYASFSRGDAVYNTQLPSSTMAFARGEAAMMFGPTWRAFDVMDINKDLDFGIAPLPKLGDVDYGWANYWAEGVNSKGEYKKEAWELLKYLSSKEVLRKLYSQQRQVRPFGEIYPRRDMASEIDNEMAAAFLLDAPSAKSWYLCSRTHDKGINDQIIDYYKTAIDEVSSTGSMREDTLETLNQGIMQILRQYQIE